MRSTTVRWTTAIAAAALMALPITASAQATTSSSPQTQTTAQQPPSQPPSQPPTQPPSQPPTQPPSQPPTQPPSEPPTQPPSQPPTTAPATPSAQPDQPAAKQHLTEARESLSQLTSLPQAAKLQGDARTQVSQVISNFNELITTQENWRASYAKLDASLTALIGADPANAAMNPTTAGVAGATGTTGTTGTTVTAGTSGTTAAAGMAELDPAIRAKLVEFRTHLNEFEKAAGGATTTEPAPDAAMPPTAATGTTTNPANPASSASSATDPTKPTSGTAATAGVAGAAGTSGSTASTDPTGSMTKADRESAASAVSSADAQKELDAISAILDKSKSGSLTKAQTAQIKKHVENLRALLGGSR